MKGGVYYEKNYYYLSSQSVNGKDRRLIGEFKLLK